MTELFAIAQEVEAQVMEREAEGYVMSRGRDALRIVLEAICPKRKPMVLGRNGAMKELLRKADKQ